MLGMKEIEQALKDLQGARRAIDKAIKSLEATKGDEREKVGTCSYCKLPILEGEPLQRGIHSACYQQAYNEVVRKGKTTWEELEELGLIAPAGKPGRKPKQSFNDIVKEAKSLIDGDEGE